MVLHICGKQCLRCNKHQIQSSVLQVTKNISPPLLCPAVQNITTQAQFHRCLQLVLHQYQQRTDYHGHTRVSLPHQFCAGKIHKAFSPASPLHYQCPSSGHHCFYCFILPFTEFRIRAVETADDGQCLIIEAPILYSGHTESSLNIRYRAHSKIPCCNEFVYIQEVFYLSMILSVYITDFSYTLSPKYHLPFFSAL